MDPRAEKRFHVVEWALIVLVAALSVAAVTLVSVGLAADLGANGNRATDIKVLSGEPHTQPTFTFCAEGASEGILPTIGYCSWNNVLDFRISTPADRQWGQNSGNCVADMNANASTAVWSVHPLDPSCWVLSNDTLWQIIPQMGTQNMFLFFEADGIGMRMWNDSYMALTQDPNTSLQSQAYSVVFSNSLLLEITETRYKPLHGVTQNLFSVNSYGSIPLTQFGLDANATSSIFVFNWATDVIESMEETEAISALTLAGIIVSVVALAIDQTVRHLLLHTYKVWIYPATHTQHHGEVPNASHARGKSLHGAAKGNFDDNEAELSELHL